jgi:hypothetical protein
MMGIRKFKPGLRMPENFPRVKTTPRSYSGMTRMARKNKKNNKSSTTPRTHSKMMVELVISGIHFSSIKMGSYRFANLIIQLIGSSQERRSKV